MSAVRPLLSVRNGKSGSLVLLVGESVEVPRIHHEELPSTQTAAIELALRGAVAGTTVVADRQQAGRGRLDHRWSSPLGGLYLSEIVGEPTGPIGLAPIAVGVRLGDALSDRFGARTEVKWPNDLVVPRPGRPARKLSGVLVDRVSRPTGPAALVIGIGINVSTPRNGYPEEIRDRIALLSEISSDAVPLPDVETTVIGAIDSAVEEMSTPHGASAIVDAANRRLYGRGRPAEIDGRPAGIVRGITPDGALLLDRHGVAEPVRAGDLTFPEPP